MQILNLEKTREVAKVLKLSGDKFGSLTKL